MDDIYILSAASLVLGREHTYPRAAIHSSRDAGTVTGDEGSNEVSPDWGLQVGVLLDMKDVKLIMYVWFRRSALLQDDVCPPLYFSS